MQWKDFLYDLGILPVVKIADAVRAAQLAGALRRGGLPAAEITFRSDAAAEAIREIALKEPEVFVCAGTVLTVENAACAVEAGAKAVISPGTNEEVVRWCLQRQVPVIPGCATPTEIERCMALGLSLVKLFPAQVVGGPAMLKALYGPYAAMRFMPTGGVSPENVGDYLSLPNVTACGGSWIVPEKVLADGDFQRIEQLARDARALSARHRQSVQS